MRHYLRLSILILVIAGFGTIRTASAQGCGCGLNAGVKQIVKLGQEIHLAGASTGTVNNGPVWVLSSGPEGSMIIDPKNLNTAVTFTNPGTYVFKLTAVCMKETTAEDKVTIIVTP